MKIAVIDPDDIAFHIIRGCFHLAGYAAEWRHIKTGREALTFLEKGEAFDLLFIESVLPDIEPAVIMQAYRHTQSGWQSRMPVVCHGTVRCTGIGRCFVVFWKIDIKITGYDQGLFIFISDAYQSIFSNWNIYTANSQEGNKNLQLPLPANCNSL